MTESTKNWKLIYQLSHKANSTQLSMVSLMDSLPLERGHMLNNGNGRVVASHLLQHLLAAYAAPPLPDSALHFSPQNLPLLPAAKTKGLVMASTISLPQKILYLI